MITAAEAGHPDRTRPASSGQLTWRFTADSVRDFAFAAGPDLRWDASGYKGILVHTLYRPSAPEWEEANRMVREALQYFSEQWYRYPYPHITSVEGPIEGMEYPMLTFDPARPEPGGAAVGAGPRARPPVDADDRRVERAALSLDGRGIQHLHRSGRRRALLQGHALWRLDRGAPAAPLPRSRDSPGRSSR